MTCQEATVGDLAVGIEGLPEEVDAEVTVRGPDDFSEPVEATTTLEDLEPGDYDVEAGTAEDGDNRYEPESETQTVTVEAGQQTDATVDYTGVPGSVQIDVEGLPEGAVPTIELQDPSDDNATVAERPEGGVIEDVPPGEYLVSPESHEGDLGLYHAYPLTVDVESEETSYATIEYIADAGELTVDVAWEPEDIGLDHDLELVDDSGEVVAEIEQSGEAMVPPGTFTLRVNEVGDGFRQFTGEDVQDVAVESNAETEASVLYEIVPGQFDVEVDGTPVDGDVTVDGPGIEGDDGEIGSTTSFGDVEPGTTPSVSTTSTPGRRPSSGRPTI